MLLKKTIMRSSINEKERLAVMLRYLATGRSLQVLKISSCISAPALCFIIPETCWAIYTALKSNYFKMDRMEYILSHAPGQDTNIETYIWTKRKHRNLKEISSAMEKEVEDVGTKWQNLRTQYNAERRKLFKTKSGQGAGDSTTKWEYFAALTFLSVQMDKCMSQSTSSMYNMEISGREIMVTECSAAFGGAFI